MRLHPLALVQSGYALMFAWVAAFASGELIVVWICWLLFIILCVLLEVLAEPAAEE
jgi:hypothetical protein